jgi:heme/copper-type cytochrome/quinol oxidase subunit 2
MTNTQGVWFVIGYVILVAFTVYVVAPLVSRWFVRRYQRQKGSDENRDYNKK